MLRRRRTPEQVATVLAEGDRLLAWGHDFDEVLRRLGISERTWRRWRTDHAETIGAGPRSIHDLECEILRLKRIVAEQSLDIEILKELNRQLTWPDPGAPLRAGQIVPLRRIR